MTKFRIPVFAPALLVAARCAALETTAVELREGPTPDGAVTIARESGELLFDDATTEAPVSLQDLLSAVSAHGTLTGLGGDDHPQYQDGARHAAAHDETFNDALAISPDTNGNATVGEHAADSVIHLSRTGVESVAGDWFFGGEPEFGGGTVWFSAPEPDGAVTLRLRDSSGDGMLVWNPATDELSFNRILAPDDVRAESVDAEFLNVTDLLSGTIGAFRTGRIEGFAQIEGIAWGDLLSRSADEDVSGAWDFLAPLRANTSASGAGATGLYGEADGAASGFAAVGAAGVAGTSDSGAKRIGVLGALNSAWLSNPALLPAGAHAGAFLGDVHVDGAATARTVAVRAIAGETIGAGQVVTWDSGGTVVVAGDGSTATAPFAGVALDDAVSTEELRVAVSGFASVVTDNAIAAGSVVTWSGDALAAHAPGDNAALGVAVEGYAGGSTTTVEVHIMAGMFGL